MAVNSAHLKIIKSCKYNEKLFYNYFYRKKVLLLRVSDHSHIFPSSKSSTRTLEHSGIFKIDLKNLEKIDLFTREIFSKIAFLSKSPSSLVELGIIFQDTRYF